MRTRMYRGKKSLPILTNETVFYQLKEKARRQPGFAAFTSRKGRAFLLGHDNNSSAVGSKCGVTLQYFSATDTVDP